MQAITDEAPPRPPPLLEAPRPLKSHGTRPLPLHHQVTSYSQMHLSKPVRGPKPTLATASAASQNQPLSHPPAHSTAIAQNLVAATPTFQSATSLVASILRIGNVLACSPVGNPHQTASPVSVPTTSRAVHYPLLGFPPTHTSLAGIPMAASRHLDQTHQHRRRSGWAYAFSAQVKSFPLSLRVGSSR